MITILLIPLYCVFAREITVIKYSQLLVKKPCILKYDDEVF